MSQTQRIQDHWVEAPKIGVKVHATDGAILDLETEMAVKTFRNIQNGNMVAVLPKNEGQAGLGKGRLQQVGRTILAVLNGGSPFPNPRQGFTRPKDGNKWNIQPNNLEWISHSDFRQQFIIEQGLQKLNPHNVLTLKDVVAHMVSEGIKDYDAIGSVFNVSADHVLKVITGKSWWYIDKFLKGVTPLASTLKLHQAREAAACFADYDKELATYMASYSTAKA